MSVLIWFRWEHIRVLRCCLIFIAILSKLLVAGRCLSSGRTQRSVGGVFSWCGTQALRQLIWCDGSFQRNCTRTLVAASRDFWHFVSASDRAPCWQICLFFCTGVVGSIQLPEANAREAQRQAEIRADQAEARAEQFGERFDASAREVKHLEEKVGSSREEAERLG